MYIHKCAKDYTLLLKRAIEVYNFTHHFPAKNTVKLIIIYIYIYIYILANILQCKSQIHALLLDGDFNLR